MATMQYSFSINGDTPNHKFSSDRFVQEIFSSSIITALDHIDTVDDDCNITFKAALSQADQDVLIGLIHVHSGQPLDPGPQTVTLSPSSLLQLAGLLKSSGG